MRNEMREVVQGLSRGLFQCETARHRTCILLVVLAAAGRLHGPLVLSGPSRPFTAGGGRAGGGFAELLSACFRFPSAQLLIQDVGLDSVALATLVVEGALGIDGADPSITEAFHW